MRDGALSITPFEGMPLGLDQLWDLNCSYLEIGHFQGIEKLLDRCNSQVSAIYHSPEDTGPRGVDGSARPAGYVDIPKRLG